MSDKKEIQEEFKVLTNAIEFIINKNMSRILDLQERVDALETEGSKYLHLSGP